MKVGSVNNFNLYTQKSNFNNNLQRPVSNAGVSEVSFAGSDDKRANRRMRDAIIAMSMLAASASPILTSCDVDDYGYARAEAHAWAGVGNYVDSTQCSHPSDTLIHWFWKYERPLPLDSLYNNFQNWDIDGTEGNKLDSLAKRNIIHYEGTREWEYNTREIGDMNILESQPNTILVYDTEIKDYKGNHEAYGKKVLRIPTTNFTIKTKDGRTLHSPKGLFVEDYVNEFDEKGASILDCKLVSRVFCQTNGDTLRVAKRQGAAEFVEKGSVSKGYLGGNSVLLKNLIGKYPTDDHIVDMKIDAINDMELRAKYVYEMDKKNN